MENLFALQSRGVQTHGVHIPGDNLSSVGGAVSVLTEYKPLCNTSSWNQDGRTGWRIALKARGLGTGGLRTGFVLYPTLNADAAFGSRT